MELVFTMLWVVPLSGFAIYGIDCLAERFNGHRLSYEAMDSLRDLWSYNERKFFRSVLKDKNMKKIERKMKPIIIDIALKSAVEDIETEGANSKIFVLMENAAERVLRDLQEKICNKTL
jgi:hypothetical protein